MRSSRWLGLISMTLFIIFFSVAESAELQVARPHGREQAWPAQGLPGSGIEEGGAGPVASRAIPVTHRHGSPGLHPPRQCGAAWRCAVQAGGRIYTQGAPRRVPTPRSRTHVSRTRVTSSYSNLEADRTLSHAGSSVCCHTAEPAEPQQRATGSCIRGARTAGELQGLRSRLTQFRVPVQKRANAASGTKLIRLSSWKERL